jgi:hypothetical protein
MLDAIGHPFFEELRHASTILEGEPLPPLFNFSHEGKATGAVVG